MEGMDIYFLALVSLDSFFLIVITFAYLGTSQIIEEEDIIRRRRIITGFSILFTCLTLFIDASGYVVANQILS